jgi:lipoprotein-anchoring transpeptidase ErfK/SrfK
MKILGSPRGLVVSLLLSMGLLTAPVLTALPSSAQPIFMSRGAYGTSIIIKTKQRRLQLLNGNGTVKVYTIAVGRAGKQWYGQTRIVSKLSRPSWSPPPEVKRDHPELPPLIKGGAHNNPMGAAAMILAGGKYAIHGTNRPSSIGTFASYGCFRMHNRDVVDLMRRVSVGTPVTVIP